jgi:uncharacterized protein
MSALAPVCLGVAFGWVLHKAGMGRYDVIVNVFRFKDLTVLKFLLSALLTGMLGLQLLGALQLAPHLPVAPTFLLGNLLGGLVFGVGMATAGFCPGTVAAGAGEGRLDYLVPGSLGLYAGAVLFGLLYPSIFPWVAKHGNLGEVTLPALMQVDGWLVVLMFWELGLMLFYLIERGPLRPPSDDASHTHAASASLRGSAR